jgi:coenzyme F420-reducing hydrogenase beta subunit
MNSVPKLAGMMECTGCMACVASCPFSALDKKMGEDGHFYVVKDDSKCVGCLKCESICKTARSIKGNNDLSRSTPYSVWSNDVFLRRHSTSGGFATAAGKWILNNGGCVFGAAFDGRRANHLMASDAFSLRSLQGSKYVWSDASSSYRQISERLALGKVLFVGTGCQVAGVLAFFADHPQRPNLYCVDIICGGVPSDLLMQSFFARHPEVTAITSFRSKRQYELKALVAEKEIALPKDSLPLAGFCAEQTMRYSCYNCPFAYAHRGSDATIGDLWGDSAPRDERDHGVSLVVVHTAKGHELLEGSDIAFSELKWEHILGSNSRLVFGQSPVTFLRKRLASNFKTMDPDRFARVYGLTSTFTCPNDFVARLLVSVRRKLFRIKSRKKVHDILNG